MVGERVLAVAQLSPGASPCPRVRGSLSRSPWPASTGSTLHGLMAGDVSIRLWQAMRYPPSPAFAIAMQSPALPGPARLTLGLVRPPALPWWVVTQCPAKTGTLTPRHTPLYISPFPLFFLPLASPSLNC